MTRKSLLIILLIALVVAGGAVWWLTRPRPASDLLTLYGNVDLRQVELAFNDADRIETVRAQEGDRVVPGETLAELDTRRLVPQVSQAEAQVAAQQAIVAKLHAGNRPQEIAQAKAAFDSATVEAANDRSQYDRANALWNASAGQAAVSRQAVDDARTAMDAAVARLASQREAYELERIGPRREDIAQAEAQLRGDHAQLAVLNRQLADARLLAPVKGVVRARLMEAGEMASPQRPVFTIAVTDPKWVRAYVNETDLPRVHPGMAATVSADGFPGRAYKGWVGFISSVAEFTPKTVQTTELRTSLVYEVRVFVTDTADDLRLGMPATVQLRLAPAKALAGRR